jgi:hypothetical protein
MQTGLKVVNGFVINENQTTELVLDFNAQKSVVHAGSSGNWLIKPTVKVLDTATWAIVNGTVEDGAAAPLEGILLSAQIFDPGAADRSEEVVVEAATVTDSNGEFALASTDQVGQVAGTVEIVGGLANQHAVLSFRQDFDCIDAAAAEPIEVAGLNAADDSSYSVDLPAGLYDAVGSSAGEATVAADGVSVEDEMETTLDFLFD